LKSKATFGKSTFRKSGAKIHFEKVEQNPLWKSGAKSTLEKWSKTKGCLVISICISKNEIIVKYI
jgi:hypothetical protein